MQNTHHNRIFRCLDSNENVIQASSTDIIIILIVYVGIYYRGLVRLSQFIPTSYGISPKTNAFRPCKRYHATDINAAVWFIFKVEYSVKAYCHIYRYIGNTNCILLCKVLLFGNISNQQLCRVCR
jgi:hypothetical protein